MNAGNFKEMVQMVGLCNICDEIGARNWECLDNIIDELKNEISNSLVDMSTLNEDMQEINDEDDYEDVIDKSKVVMIDISETDTEYCQTNPLPKDSPVLMIHVGVAEKLSDYACNKDGAMNDFHTRAKVLKGHLVSKFIEQLEEKSTCPFHCMSWLLEENGACEY